MEAATQLGPWLTLAQGGGDKPAFATSASLSEVVAPYMGVFFVAFFVAILATFIMRKLALANGIVDWPDHKRKKHVQPIAYLGGVAIFFGWLAGIATGYLTPPHDAGPDLAKLSYVRFPPYIVLGGAVILLTGLFDDVYGIRARVKVGGQLFAAAALASVNLSRDGLPIGVELTQSCLGVLGIPGMPYWVVYVLGTILVAVFVVGGCNALNLLDGLDGLAAGTTAISCVGFLLIVSILAVRHYAAGSAEGLTSDPARIVMCLALLGGLLGFLPYNFNPATIFMGDAGSLLIGYLTVTIMLLFADTASSALLLVTASLIIFALPITDTSLAIFRRKMRGQGMFAPDNQHIHHLLRRRGLGVKQTALVLYLVAAGFAVVGCAMVLYQFRWRYILAVFFVMYGFIMVMAYKYGEQLHILDQNRAGQAQDDSSAPDEPAVDPDPTTADDAPNPPEAPVKPSPRPESN